MLGQVHGVITEATSDLDWIDVPLDDEESLSREDVRSAALEVHAKIGDVHAALNTGAHDMAIVGAGFWGGQGRTKKKGFDLSRVVKEGGSFLERLKGKLRWSKLILGSLTKALEKEIGKTPGADFSAEAIKEFVEVLENLAESSAAREPKKQQRNG